MKKRRQSVDASLPANVTVRFEKQLRHLVDQLSRQGFAGQYLREEMFTKYLDSSLVSPEVRKSAAIEKWLAAESRNSTTNLRLAMAECGVSGDFGWTTFDKYVKVVRRYIASVLGPLPYPQILYGSTFSNGASTRVRRSPAAAIHKLTGEVHITDSAVKHWITMASGSRLSQLPLTIVPSSVLFTVPKKTEIDRVACKEPEANAMLQRSVGEFIARRLRRVGIDLKDQTRNQQLACRAFDDRLATIDLSSASDTISYRLVLLLLPFDWFSLLDDLRVTHTCVEGSSLELNMFSSMGNGFTFELESLIFWAMAKAVAYLTGTKGPISVFGDDIIVPSSMARRFMRLILFFGFIPNEKKSHVTGSFRESCGRHYWRGLDVTPFYIRKAVTTLPELINTLNHLLEWDGRGYGFFTTEEAYEFWLRWRRFVPEFLWGGIDPADPSCLVTGDPPRKRLVPELKSLSFPQLAGLYTWLHRCDTRVSAVNILDPSDSALTPAVPIGFKAERVEAAGERSTWRPGIAFQ